MKPGESASMKQRLNLVLMLAVGLLGGSILSHYLLPTTAFAQSSTAVLIPSSAEQTQLTTARGSKFGDMDLNRGTIKLSPVVKVLVNKTDQTVTIELSAENNSR
jgi:hypothetical protein